MISFGSSLNLILSFVIALVFEFGLAVSKSVCSTKFQWCKKSKYHSHEKKLIAVFNLAVGNYPVFRICSDSGAGEMEVFY